MTDIAGPILAVVTAICYAVAYVAAVWRPLFSTRADRNRQTLIAAMFAASGTFALMGFIAHERVLS
jgi:hypothetical protein